jgi:hypothetical protein
VWIAGTVGCALLTVLVWTFASPVGSSPDDDFHQTSIWCPPPIESSGCQLGENSEGVTTVFVPTPVIEGCYRYRPEQSAECPRDRSVSESARYDDGQYPGPYYHVMNLLVTDNAVRSLSAMRLLNGVLAVGLAALAMALAPGALGRVQALAILGSWVPLGLFLITSVNPSAWALIGVSTHWCLLLSLLLLDDRRRVVLASAGVAISGLVASVARADAAVYILLSTAAVLLLVWPPRARWLRLIVPGLVCLVAVGVFLTSGQADVVNEGVETEDLGRPVVTLLFHDVTDMPDLIAGGLGTWGLGWLDTDMPSGVWFPAIVVFGSLLTIGLAAPSRRKLGAFLLVALALVVVPVRVLIESQDFVGAAVQPRYLLPMLPLLLGLGLVEVGGGSRRMLSRSQARWLWGALTVAQSLALHTNLRRYVTGLDVRGFDLDDRVEWWWWSVPTPMMWWFVGTVAFGAVTASLVLFPHRTMGRIEAIGAPAVGSGAPDGPRSETSEQPPWQ